MSVRPLGKWEHDGPYEVYCITHWAGVGVTQTVYCYNYRHDMGAFWAQLRNITIVELADIWPSTGKKRGAWHRTGIWGLLQRMQGATGGSR